MNHYHVEFKRTAPHLIKLKTDEEALNFALDNRGKGLVKLSRMKSDERGVLREEEILKEWGS